MVTQDTPEGAVVSVARVEVEKRQLLKAFFQPRLIGCAVGMAVALLVYFAPSAQHIPSSTRAVMSLFGLSIVFWMCSVLESHMVMLLMLALLLLIRVPPDIVFSGFATSPFWVLFGALYLGFVMKKTGLAQRIGLMALKLFKPSYRTILLGLFVTGVILSLTIISFAVRIAIMVPLAWSLVKSARLPQRSVASALIVISAFEMAVLPGFATLTGSAMGLLYIALFQRLGLQISWLSYARAAAVPAMICSVIVLASNLLLLRPERPIGDCFFVDAELSRLGPLTKNEKWALLIIAVSLGLWATQGLHRVNEAGIALLALVALFAAGVMSPGDFGSGMSWQLLIFTGGVFSIVKVIPTYNIDHLVGGIIFDKLEPYLVNVFAVLLLTSLAVFLLRFFETTGVLASLIVFMALYGPLLKMGVPPLVLAVATIFPMMPFWFLYQNFWFGIAEEITEQMAFTPRVQAKMATICAGAVLLSLVISVGYWYAIGLVSKFAF